MSAHGVAGPGEATRRARRPGQSAGQAGGQPAGQAGGQPAGQPGGLPAGAAPRPQPDLRVVTPVDERAARQRLRLRLAVAAAGIFVSAVVFGLVGVHVLLAQNQFRLDRLTTQAQAQEAAYQRLRLQVDQLESPQRIVATAEGRLGMVQPATVTYLTPRAPVPATASPGAATTPPASATPTSQIPAPAGGPAEWAVVKPQLVTSP